MATAEKKKKIKITCFNFTWVSNPKRSQNDSWNFSQASRRPENDTKKSRALKWYVTHSKLISTHVDHYQHLHFAEFSNGFLNTYNPETLLICFTPLSEWLKKTLTIISNTPMQKPNTNPEFIILEFSCSSAGSLVFTSRYCQLLVLILFILAGHHEWSYFGFNLQHLLGMHSIILGSF